MATPVEKLIIAIETVGLEEAQKQLEYFTGGVIPDIIIPNVVGKLIIK